MFTDIIGFTGLMRKDEHKTIHKLESHRQYLEVLHEEFDGRIIQYYGDGSLSIFKSPSKAVSCALSIQEHVRRLGFPLKIGIHLGDVVEKGAAVYGDSVNVASRIESIGIADSILFSEGIWRAIKNEGFEAKRIGALRFKHVNRPIKVYGLIHDELAVPDKNHLDGKLADRSKKKNQIRFAGIIIIFLVALGLLWQRNLALNSLLDGEITTVGVMPFRIVGINNLDQNFRSGLLENLVTNLSSFYGLQVVSSRATEPYAQSTKKPKEIGKELGASHLLYGTCREGASDSIRINLELVDVRNGRNVWAKAFSKTPEDLFANQIDISNDLASFLEAKENPFKDPEEEDIPGMSITSYRLIKEARAEASTRTRSGLSNAIKLLELVIDRDSTLALGYALLSQHYAQMHINGYLDADEAQKQAEKYGGQAFFYDRNLAEAYASQALLNYAFFLTEPTEIIELLQQAVQLRPSYDYAYFLLGKVHFDLEDYEMADNYFSLATKINPDEYTYHDMVARTVEMIGNHRKAESIYKKLNRRFPDDLQPKLSLIRHYAETENHRVLQHLLQDLPSGFDQRKAQLLAEIQSERIDEATNSIKDLKASFPDKDLGDLMLTFYDKQENNQGAWEILDSAIEQRRIWLKEIKVKDLSENIRRDPKYQQLLERIGLVPF